MVLTKREKADIDKWRHGLQGEHMRLQYTVNDDEAGRQINAFCVELADLAPEITLIYAKETDVRFSEIMISPNIRYNSVPVENELGPFLNSLSSPGFFPEGTSGELQQALTSITAPAMLKVYVSSQCPFCPQVVTQALMLARLNPAIDVTVIDGNLFPEKAKEDKIRSVPTLILDDRFRWTGLADIEELIQVIAQRDKKFPGVETLKNIIQDKRAEELAEMMMNRGEIFPAFIELLTDIKWSVRLGAMAVFEHLSEKSPELCLKINADLVKRFSESNDQIKGDIIYLLGESGDRSVVGFLKSIVEGDFAQEVVEAAKDALDSAVETAE